MHGFYFNISSRSTENFPAVAQNQLKGGGSPFGSYRTDLTAPRAPRTSAESTKAGGLARDKVRNVRGKVRCRLLSSCGENPPATSVTKCGPERCRDELTNLQNYPR